MARINLFSESFRRIGDEYNCNSLGKQWDSFPQCAALLAELSGQDSNASNLFYPYRKRSSEDQRRQININQQLESRREIQQINNKMSFSSSNNNRNENIKSRAQSLQPKEQRHEIIKIENQSPIITENKFKKLNELCHMNNYSSESRTQDYIIQQKPILFTNESQYQYIHAQQFEMDQQQYQSTPKQQKQSEIQSYDVEDSEQQQQQHFQQQQQQQQQQQYQQQQPSQQQYQQKQQLQLEQKMKQKKQKKDINDRVQFQNMLKTQAKKINNLLDSQIKGNEVLKSLLSPKKSEQKKSKYDNDDNDNENIIKSIKQQLISQIQQPSIVFKKNNSYSKRNSLSSENTSIVKFQNKRNIFESKSMQQSPQISSRKQKVSTEETVEDQMNLNDGKGIFRNRVFNFKLLQGKESETKFSSSKYYLELQTLSPAIQLNNVSKTTPFSSMENNKTNGNTSNQNNQSEVSQFKLQFPIRQGRKDPPQGQYELNIEKLINSKYAKIKQSQLSSSKESSEQKCVAQSLYQFDFSKNFIKKRTQIKVANSLNTSANTQLYLNKKEVLPSLSQVQSSQQQREQKKNKFSYLFKGKQDTPPAPPSIFQKSNNSFRKTFRQKLSNIVSINEKTTSDFQLNSSNLYNNITLNEWEIDGSDREDDYQLADMKVNIEPFLLDLSITNNFHSKPQQQEEIYQRKQDQKQINNNNNNNSINNNNINYMNNIKKRNKLSKYDPFKDLQQQ